MPSSNTNHHHSVSPLIASVASPTDAYSPARGRRRASSFTGFITKLLPSNKPERGGTLRRHGFWEKPVDDEGSSLNASPTLGPGLDGRRDSNQLLGWNTPQDLPRRASSMRASSARVRYGKRAASVGHAPRSEGIHPAWSPRKGGKATVTGHEASIATTISSPRSTVERASVMEDAILFGRSDDDQSRAQHLFELKKEARRLRQSLKESGDFLGVQGVNPETGEMDVLTPTSSSNSTVPLNLSPRLGGLAQRVKESKQAYRDAKRQHDIELQRAQSRREKERMEKIEKEKEAIRLEQRKVKWRKEVGQWSSVAEPNLSPIAQSQRSSTPSAKPESPPSSPAQAALQEHIPLPSAFIDNPRQVSSETIIHSTSQHDSLHCGPPATEVGIHASPVASSVSKENNQAPLHGILKDGRTCQKTPCLGEGVPLLSQQGRLPTGRFSPQPDVDERPDTTSVNSHQPFLGERPPIQIDPGGHAESVHMGTSSLMVGPNHCGQNNATSQGGSRKVAGASPDLQQTIRDGLEKTRAHLENLHPAVVLSRVEQARNPVQPILGRDQAHGATTRALRSKVVQFQTLPNVPQRQDSSQRTTGTENDTSYKLTDPSTEVPALGPKNIEGDGLARMPSHSPKNEPVGEWADTLIQDIDLVSREPQMTAESASIPIITTTGSGLGLLSPAAGGYDGPVDDTGDQATTSMCTTEAAMASDPLGSNMMKDSSDYSPARTALSACPSADPCLATATNATTSSRQLTPTKLRTERLSRKACLHRRTGRRNSSSRRRRPGSISPPTDLCRTASPQPATPPSNSSPGRRDRPHHDVGGSPCGEAMAQEAAVAAVARADVTSSSPRGVVDGGALAAAAASRPSKAAGSAGTGGPSRTGRIGGTGGVVTAMVTRTTGKFSALGLAQRAGVCTATALWTYWCLVQPAFNGCSPMRRRLSEGRPTWPDVAVCLLAGVFLVLALVAWIWAIRVVLFATGILKITLKGLGLLFGI